MRRSYHLGQDIRGGIMALRRGELDGVCTDNEGRVLSRNEILHEFTAALARGEKLVRCCRVEECPDFDVFKHGCPGHEHPSTCEEICARFPGAEFYTFCVGGLAGPYLPMVLVAERKAAVGPWHDDFDACRIWIERELERIRSAEVAS